MSERCIVLLGIGHTNAHVVRQWARRPIPGYRLVCVSTFPATTYSGMLPGTLAGQFNTHEMEIPLTPLTELAGAELILDEVVALDPQRRELRFARRDPLQFDMLSIGVGSIPAGRNQFESPSLVPIKPMQTFLERLDARLDQCGPAARCVVVGGGVAGVEVALCLDTRLRQRSSQSSSTVSIVTSGDKIAEGMSPAARRKLRSILADRSITVATCFRVTGVDQSAVWDESGNRKAADMVIWATGAAAPPVLSRLDLPTDDRGFIGTTPTLRTTADFPIFAVGDSGTIVSDPAPKAGVYAVRQAPILWANLRATAEGSALREFHPQVDFLKILNTGEGKALVEYRGWCFHGRWCWWLKWWIDKRFISKYQVAKP